MADELDTLRRYEVAMSLEHTRAVLALLSAVEELRAADRALGVQVNWDGASVDRWQRAVARVQVAQETVDAFGEFEPGAWLT